MSAQPLTRRYERGYGNPEGIPEDKTRCVWSVVHYGSLGNHQCYYKRGHGKEGLYCRRHAKLMDSP